MYVRILGASPSIASVFRLYSSLEAGLRVTDLCLHHDLPAMGINERLACMYLLRVTCHVWVMSILLDVYLHPALFVGMGQVVRYRDWV